MSLFLARCIIVFILSPLLFLLFHIFLSICLEIVLLQIYSQIFKNSNFEENLSPFCLYLFAKSNFIVDLEEKKIEAKTKDVYVHCFKMFQFSKFSEHKQKVNERWILMKDFISLIPSVIKRWALWYTLTTTSVIYLKKINLLKRKHVTIRYFNIPNVKII